MKSTILSSSAGDKFKPPDGSRSIRGQWEPLGANRAHSIASNRVNPAGKLSVVELKILAVVKPFLGSLRRNFLQQLQQARG